jgi:hypothetical protein
MFCTSCGTQLPPGAAACPTCGARVIIPQPMGGPAINNYLVPSILVTFCCCLPFGIIAIVYAAQVNGKMAAGDTAGAEASARNAKMWCWIGAICGLLAGLAYAGISVLTLSRH